MAKSQSSSSSSRMKVDGKERPTEEVKDAEIAPVGSGLSSEVSTITEHQSGEAVPQIHIHNNALFSLNCHFCDDEFNEIIDSATTDIQHSLKEAINVAVPAGSASESDTSKDEKTSTVAEDGKSSSFFGIIADSITLFLYPPPETKSIKVTKKDPSLVAKSCSSAEYSEYSEEDVTHSSIEVVISAPSGDFLPSPSEDEKPSSFEDAKALPSEGDAKASPDEDVTPSEDNWPGNISLLQRVKRSFRMVYEDEKPSSFEDAKASPSEDDAKASPSEDDAKASPDEDVTPSEDNSPGNTSLLQRVKRSFRMVLRHDDEDEPNENPSDAIIPGLSKEQSITKNDEEQKETPEHPTGEIFKIRTSSDNETEESGKDRQTDASSTKDDSNSVSDEMDINLAKSHSLGSMGKRKKVITHLPPSLKKKVKYSSPIKSFRSLASKKSNSSNTDTQEATSDEVSIHNVVQDDNTSKFVMPDPSREGVEAGTCPVNGDDTMDKDRENSTTEPGTFSSSTTKRSSAKTTSPIIPPPKAETIEEQAISKSKPDLLSRVKHSFGKSTLPSNHSDEESSIDSKDASKPTDNEVSEVSSGAESKVNIIDMTLSDKASYLTAESLQIPPAMREKATYSDRNAEAASNTEDISMAVSDNEDISKADSLKDVSEAVSNTKGISDIVSASKDVSEVVSNTEGISEATSSSKDVSEAASNTKDDPDSINTPEDITDTTTDTNDASDAVRGSKDAAEARDDEASDVVSSPSSEQVVEIEMTLCESEEEHTDANKQDHVKRMSKRGLFSKVKRSLRKSHQAVKIEKPLFGEVSMKVDGGATLEEALLDLVSSCSSDASKGISHCDSNNGKTMDCNGSIKSIKSENSIRSLLRLKSRSFKSKGKTEPSLMSTE